VKNNTILIVIISVIISLGAGFFGGMQYQKSQRAIAFNRNGQGNIGGRQQGNLAANRPVAGQITSVTDNTITVKSTDGSSKIVVFAPSTKINKSSDGAAADLKVGTEVTAFGSTGTDGTVTATDILIGNGFFMGRGPQPSITKTP